MLQNIIVIAIVCACGLLLLRGAVRAVRGKKTACGCSECPAVKPTERRPAA